MIRHPSPGSKKRFGQGGLEVVQMSEDNVIHAVLLEECRQFIGVHGGITGWVMDHDHSTFRKVRRFQSFHGFQGQPEAVDLPLVDLEILFGIAGRAGFAAVVLRIG